MAKKTKANPWMLHVKSTKAKFPKLPLREVLKKAKTTYKK